MRVSEKYETKKTKRRAAMKLMASVVDIVEQMRRNPKSRNRPPRKSLLQRKEHSQN